MSLRSRKTKVILFGLNYNGTQHQLNGCINDTTLMKNCQESYLEVPSKNIEVYTDETTIKPTKTNMIRILKEAIAKVNDGKYHTLWIHYSGHGTHYWDENGDENIVNDGGVGMDEALCPLDNTLLLDDELNELFGTIKQNKMLVCIFDCCHSGTALDLPYHFSYRNGVISQENISGSNKIKCNAILLSGCKDIQYSADAFKISKKFDYTGAFTTALLRACQQKYSISLRDIMIQAFDFLQKKGFAQIPQITCNFPVNVDKPFMKSRKRRQIVNNIRFYRYYANIFGYYYSVTGQDVYLQYKETLMDYVRRLMIV